MGDEVDVAAGAGWPDGARVEAAITVGAGWVSCELVTVIVAIMLGWMLQKNGKVPGWVKVNVKVWPLSITPLSHNPPLLVVVWMTAPAFVHVTVVPASTLRSWWEKSKICKMGPAPETGGATIGVEPGS